MNTNKVATGTWSNPESKEIYLSEWPQEPKLAKMYKDGWQCGGCSFYAKFNSDWGLCNHLLSRHHLETVFEHFTCPSYENECWGPHSFTCAKDGHCQCSGAPAKTTFIVSNPRKKNGSRLIEAK